MMVAANLQGLLHRHRSSPLTLFLLRSRGGHRRPNLSAASNTIVPNSSSSFSTAAQNDPSVPVVSGDLATVRLLSINDVYDLTKLPRLASLIRSQTIPPSAVTLNGDFLSPSALSSVDNGRGHVAAIRAAGVTHVCLGNHEADLPLNVLKARLDDLGRRGKVVVLNSNVSGLGRRSREMDVVRSNCGRIKVGLMGLLSDESGMFRDGTFRGLNIADTKKKYEILIEKIDMMGNKVDCLVPLTHQSLSADVDLAKWMLTIQSRVKKKRPTGGVILGGHEHVKFHEFVSSNEECHDSSVQIVKTGFNAERAAIVDLQFNPTTRTLENVSVDFEELDECHRPCPVVQSVVDKHLSALHDLHDYMVFDKKSMLSDYFVEPSTGDDLPLSSEHTRYEQTTVGALFCTAIRSELETDVCIINGAPIKASKIYANGSMSYDDIRNELPFPLKMVVVEMTRKQLDEAIHYSRTNVEKGKSATKLDDGRVERRSYLQVDFDFWRGNFCKGDRNNVSDDQILSVALPRNLLKGFCKIQPLMDLHHDLESRNALPDEDDYIKAVDLIVRFCCKDRWATIARKLSFSDLDANDDGSLSREEIHTAIKNVLGEDPSDALVSGMVDAIDEDANGLIDENEFNAVLAKLRRQS